MSCSLKCIQFADYLYVDFFVYLHVGAWYGVLDVVSQLSVVTNALLIAITSNFVGFEVYRRGGYRQEYNDSGLVPDISGHDQGLSGYANWSSTEFLVTDLVDGSAFPVYSAQSLELTNEDGTDVRKDNPPLYLPFIDFDCILDNFNAGNCSVAPENVIISALFGPDRNITTFNEESYKKFYRNSTCRKLVVDEGENTAPDIGNLGSCFDRSSICR